MVSELLRRPRLRALFAGDATADAAIAELHELGAVCVVVQGTGQDGNGRTRPFFRVTVTPPAGARAISAFGAGLLEACLSCLDKALAELDDLTAQLIDRFERLLEASGLEDDPTGAGRRPG